MHLYSDVSTMNTENMRFLLSLPHPALNLFDVSRPLIIYSAFQWALCSLSWYVVPQNDTRYRSLTPSNGAEGLLHLCCMLDFSLDSAESNVCLDPKPACQHRLTFSPPNPGDYFPTLHSNSCWASVSYRKPWCNDWGCWRNMKWTAESGLAHMLLLHCC